MTRPLPAIALLSALCGVSSAADWPQWLGPDQAATWEESGIVDEFPESGLTVKWRVPVSYGYSGPAVVDGKVYVTDYQKESGEIRNNPGASIKLTGQERVLCVDAKNGDTLWEYAYDCPYDVSYPAGPRAVPTVAGDHVYTLGTEGHLYCFHKDTGSVIWSKSLVEEYKVEAPFWGYSAPPFVDGDTAYVMVGGEGHLIVAFNRMTGKEQWRALSSQGAGYCPPTIMDVGGTRQLIVWYPEAINGLNPENGEVYWSIDLKPDYRMSIALPRREGNTLFASGIGSVGAAITLDESNPSAEILWRGKSKTALYSANATPVIVDGVVYGCDCGTGHFRAVDLKTGDRLWESMRPTADTDRRAGHGTAYIVRHEDRFFLFSETGDLILAKLTPEKYEEISRFHVLEPTNEAFGRPVVWTHPAFADKAMFVRNDKELVCVSLAAE